MVVDVAVVAGILALGNIIFRQFEPQMCLWRRVLKCFALLTATAIISYFFGRIWVITAFAIAVIPVMYIHAIWLPRRGVNGWTAEPRDKYYALRGWPPPDK